jgi:NADH-quinone oxidoreductase subunit C
MSENSPPRTPPPVHMATTIWQDELTAHLAHLFPDADLKFESYLGQNFIVCPPDVIEELIRHLHDHDHFDFLVDVTAADYPKRAARFDLIYILYSFQRNERLRIKAQASEQQPVPSITPVFSGANWLEREVFDMFGISFSGHPNLKRILMPDEWQGYPLRKDTSILAMDNEWVQANLGIESGQ